MNCYNHPDTPAAAYCRSCGRPLCALCQRTSDGVIYCAEHAPLGATLPAAAPQPAAGGAPATPASGPSFSFSASEARTASASSGAAPPPPPPGVAADPANPYAAPASPVTPAMMHSGISPGLAFLLGLIPGVGAIYNGQYVKGLVHAAIFGLLMTISQNGQNPLIVMFAVTFYCYMPFEAYHTARKRQLGVPVEEWSSLMGPKLPASPVPIGPIVLILIGVLFLLNSLDLLDMHAVVRFWPVLLIVGGIAMLVARLRSPGSRNRTAGAGFQAAPVSETLRER